MLKPLLIEGGRLLANAGAIAHVRIVGSDKGFTLIVNGQFVVANRQNETRYFSRVDTCCTWLHEIGVKLVNEVDLSDWRIANKPEKAKSQNKRDKVQRRSTSKVAKK